VGAGSAWRRHAPTPRTTLSRLGGGDGHGPHPLSFAGSPAVRRGEPAGHGGGRGWLAGPAGPHWGGSWGAPPRGWALALQEAGGAAAAAAGGVGQGAGRPELSVGPWLGMGACSRALNRTGCVGGSVGWKAGWSSGSDQQLQQRRAPSQRRSPPEVRERAVGMVQQAIEDSGERFGVITRVAGQLGMGPSRSGPGFARPGWTVVSGPDPAPRTRSGSPPWRVRCGSWAAPMRSWDGVGVLRGRARRPAAR
jgi:hypothetical protein